jgi:hypothetical protein
MLPTCANPLATPNQHVREVAPSVTCKLRLLTTTAAFSFNSTVLPLTAELNGVKGNAEVLQRNAEAGGESADMKAGKHKRSNPLTFLPLKLPLAITLVTINLGIQ